MNISVAFFSGTTVQGFLTFGFRVYISQLYRVMSFQIHRSTTSCLTNTCIILHMIAKLKIFVAFSSGTTIQVFGFRVFISQLQCVMGFQNHHSTTFCLPKYLDGGVISEQKLTVLLVLFVSFSYMDHQVPQGQW